MEDKVEISKGNMDKYKTWNNKIFDGANSLEDLSWIGKYHDNIANWILNTYSNKGTQNCHYSSLAVYFRDVNPNEKLREKYGQLSLLAGKENEKKVIKNKQKDDRPHITHEQIIEIRDKLKNKEFDSYDDNIKYLIFCLYTMVYPLRSEWADTEILQGYSGINPNKNYMIVDGFKNKKTIYELHLSSGMKGHDEITIPMTKNLSKIIWNSIQKYPRKYILAKKSDMNEPMGYDNLYLILSAFGLGIDQIRSSRTTYEWLKNTLTRENKENMAKFMRSSVETLDKYYNKVEKVTPVEIPDENDVIAKRKEANRLAGIRYRAKLSKEEVAKRKREYRARVKLRSAE